MDIKEIKEKFVGKYEILKLIGRGEFGKIYRACKKDTNEIFVIK